jgi:eukaryotic-like serine/threonine-protein kinase
MNQPAEGHSASGPNNLTTPLVHEEAPTVVALRTDGSSSISHYRIVRKLGQGGMGEVYLAERADGEFQQQVALKTLLPSFAQSPSVMGRLLAERQILAKLNHPNIARLFDGGTDARGLPFLVMEYVDGIRIDQYCESQNFSTRERVRLFLKICDAVSAAHDALIVHRDLKPDNILIDQRGEPKLLDFGIAKVLSDDPVFAGNVQTQTGFAPMTQRYASPEQIRGDCLTTASDIYGLAVLLHELLVGHSPYRDADLKGMQIVTAITQYDPILPSARAEQASAPIRAKALRGDLDAILLRALRKDPTDRYRRVEQFAEDLRNYLQGKPVSAMRGNSWYRATRYFSRHWLGLGAATALVALSSFGVWQLKLQRDGAERERDAAENARDAAAQTTAFLSDLFTRVDPSAPSSIQGDADLSMRNVIDGGHERLLQGFSGQPQVRLGLLITLGEVYLNLGELPMANDLIAQARSERAQMRSADQARLDLAYGRLLLSQERYAEAIQALSAFSGQNRETEKGRLRALISAQQAYGQTEALNTFQAYEKLFADITPESAQDSTNQQKFALNFLHASLLDTRDDAQRCQQLLVDVIQALNPDLQIRAALLSGDCAGRGGNDSLALRNYGQAMDLARKHFGIDSAAFAQALCARAGLWIRQKKMLQADTDLAQAKQITLRRFGPTHARSAAVILLQAQSAFAQGQWAKAHVNYADSAVVFEQLGGGQQGQIAKSYQGSGGALRAMQRLPEAAVALEKASLAMQWDAPLRRAVLALELGRLYCTQLPVSEHARGMTHLQLALQFIQASTNPPTQLRGDIQSAISACSANTGISEVIR